VMRDTHADTVTDCDVKLYELLACVQAHVGTPLIVLSGFRTPELTTTLARFRTQIEIFREENVPIFAELEEHSARYQRITGSMTAEWEDIERPLPQLQPFLKSPDRSVRERAFRAAHGDDVAAGAVE